MKQFTMNVNIGTTIAKLTLETTIDEAIEKATREAEVSKLPMTIYKGENSNGFWFTNAFSLILKQDGCELFLSIVPQCWFY